MPARHADDRPTCQRNDLLKETYRQLVLHLEIPGITMLLDAQEGRSVRQAGIAIQSKLTEHIRSTDHQRSWRRAREYHRKDAWRERATAQLSDPREYMSQKTRIEGALTRRRWPTETGFRHTSAYGLSS